eukprot:5085307-Pleurochrysis_carterae.AAC.1
MGLIGKANCSAPGGRGAREFPVRPQRLSKKIFHARPFLGCTPFMATLPGPAHHICITTLYVSDTYLSASEDLAQRGEMRGDIDEI